MTSNTNYSPLHVHTNYSLLDGIIQPRALAKRLKELDIQACAITDHGWMGGIVEFYQELTSEGIKPLIGIEAYCTNDKEGVKQKIRDNYHLVLIAKNQEGYRLLLEEMGHAATNNFYYKPRIEYSRLERLAGNVVACTACLGGVLKEHIDFIPSEENEEFFTHCEAQPGLDTKLEFLLQTFGEDLFLEVQNWPSPDGKQEAYNSLLIGLATKRGLPLVITSDAHYLTREDYELHEHVMASQFKMSIEAYRNSSTMKYGPWFYVKPPDEMETLASNLGIPEACDNTNLVASRCDVEIPLNKGFLLPKYDITQDKDYQKYMKSKCS